MQGVQSRSNVVKADDTQVKIGIFEDITRAYITANHDYEVFEESITEPLLILERKARQEVLLRSSPATAKNLVIASEPDLLSSSLNILFKCKGDKQCVFTVKEYHGDKNNFAKFRGDLIIKSEKKCFAVINQLGLEEYLRGVVPGEMPVSWPLEALKAQAVAARTYTIKNIGRRRALGYDLKASVADQMYKGIGAEDSKTNKAISETQGEYLKDKQGLPVEAYYSSHAGLFTASPEDGWGLSPKHYLVQVKEAGSDYKWEIKLSVFDLSQKLTDLGVGDIKAVTLIERAPEGRAKRVLVSGVKGKRLLTGEEFRHKLGLKSTMFSLSYTPSSLDIEGYGFGHGIGMSQHGAKQLAQTGKGYREILAWYYHGTHL